MRNIFTRLFSSDYSQISQTDAVIKFLQTGPKTRSELGKVTIDGYKIANVTARVTEARQRLKKLGMSVVCREEKQKRIGKRVIRFTSYEIVQV